MARPTLKMFLEQEGGVSVVAVQGPVDSESFDQFKEELDAVCLTLGARVLLDCRQLTYLNSRAIGLIMKYHRGLVVNRGRFALYGLNERMVRTLELLQLGKALATFSTREEALAAMR